MIQTIPQTFDIKSARLNAFVILLKTCAFSEFAADFNKHKDKIKEFSSFPFILDLSLFNAADAVPLNEILPFFQAERLKIIALSHHDEQFAAVAAGLGLHFQLTAKTSKSVITADSGAAPAATADSNLPAPTLIIDKPIRSGQQIYAKGRDLIINAIVSEGAEVIADGNVIVFAPVRGRVIAGANGNTDARIYIASMQAQLIAIAGIYRIFEQKLSDFFYKQNVMINLVHNRLTIVALTL